MTSLLKKPSAWIPIALSLIVVIAWGVALATHHVPTPHPNADEGTGAHLFQIWLALEVLMIGFFAVKWLPQEPKEALVILSLQVLGVIAGCAPVAYFRL